MKLLSKTFFLAALCALLHNCVANYYDDGFDPFGDEYEDYGFGNDTTNGTTTVDWSTTPENWSTTSKPDLITTDNKYEFEVRNFLYGALAGIGAVAIVGVAYYFFIRVPANKNRAAFEMKAYVDNEIA